MRILLVDPSSSLLPLVQAPLQSLSGLEFYCAPSSLAALEQARALGAIDVLICDPFADDLDGFHLQSEIRQFNPKLGTLFLSNADLSSHAHALDGACVLHLPIDPDQLRAFIRKHLTFSFRLLPPLRVGQTFGPFELVEDRGATNLTHRFLALQSGLNRSVILTLLNPKAAQDPEVHAAFLNHAGAKARVSHPSVLAVYEAGELEGRTYYASEALDAPSLQSFLDNGDALPGATLLQIAQNVARSILHLDQTRTPYRTLQAAEIFLPPQGNPRIVNPAAAFADPDVEDPSRQTLVTLGDCLLRLLPFNASPALRAALERTQPQHPDPFLSFAPFLEAIQESAKNQASPQGTPHPASEKPQAPAPLTLRTPILLISLLLASLALPELWIRLQILLFAPEIVPGQIEIPAGDYLVGGPEEAAVPLTRFWIDETEISVAQYAEFLRSRTAPANGSPSPWPPTPQGWESWPALLEAKNLSEEQKTSLQRPITNLSWREAAAYAKWAGRQLPTAEEWEAAARGSRGLRFAWGDDPYGGQANVQPENCPDWTGAPSPVQTQPDRSPFGARGMVGNVAEWTASQPSPDRALVKGGHFASPLLPLDTASILAIETRQPYLGFRTVSHSLPRKP